MSNDRISQVQLLARKFGIMVRVFDPTAAGVGDTVSKITSALGIRPCAGCKARQDKLNAVLPYEKEPTN